MLRNLKLNAKHLRTFFAFPNLKRNLVRLNDVGELQKVFQWKGMPLLDDPILNDFDYLEDVNGRRIRDAESIAVVMKNAAPKVALEIGTSDGRTTALMAGNAPESMVFTVNIPPEEIAEGGKLVTYAPDRDRIGKYYRERGFKNVTQILANTKTWKPDIGSIDVAFIDGCHDTEFVINDTKKIAAHLSRGGFILWHDFNLDLVNRHEWIYSVCLGVEKLYEKGILKGPLFHVKDSWVGIFRSEA